MKHFEKPREVIRARYFKDLEIYFIDKETIKVVDKVENRIFIFHRWFKFKRGDYFTTWRPFQQALRETKSIDINYIFKTANRLNVEHEYSPYKLDIDGKQIEVMKPKKRSVNKNISLKKGQE